MKHFNVGGKDQNFPVNAFVVKKTSLFSTLGLYISQPQLYAGDKGNEREGETFGQNPSSPAPRFVSIPSRSPCTPYSDGDIFLQSSNHFSQIIFRVRAVISGGDSTERNFLIYFAV